MKKFARQCDLTNELMNEGWVIGDGDMYIKYEADAINAAIEMGYKSIDDAYKEDAMYWTEWKDETDFQYAIDEQNNIIELQKLNTMESTLEYLDCLASLKKVNNGINRQEVILWFNENDIDYFNMTDLEMYILYIERNIANN